MRSHYIHTRTLGFTLVSPSLVTRPSFGGSGENRKLLAGTYEVELKAVIATLLLSAAFVAQRQVSIIREPILYSTQPPNAVGGSRSSPRSVRGRRRVRHLNGYD